MANRHRGEIDAHLNGVTHKLCLTLGALAELEHAFGDSDMVALAQRFESGRLRAQDCIRIIGAGLRGAGSDIADEAVARMQTNGGLNGFVEIVARLLQATFGSDTAPASTTPSVVKPVMTPVPTAPTPAAPARGEDHAAASPFPGAKR